MKKLAIIFVRPIYKALLERPIWWFLSRVKAYFFAEVGIQLGNIERRLALDHSARNWIEMDDRLRRLEAANAAQWEALEQLLIAMLRQPAARSQEVVSGQMATAIQPDADRNPVHAASTIR